MKHKKNLLILIAIIIAVSMATSFCGCSQNNNISSTSIEDQYYNVAEGFVKSGDIDKAISALEEGIANTKSDKLQKLLDEIKSKNTTTAAPTTAAITAKKTTAKKTTAKAQSSGFSKEEVFEILTLPEEDEMCGGWLMKSQNNSDRVVNKSNYSIFFWTTKQFKLVYGINNDGSENAATGTFNLSNSTTLILKYDDGGTETISIKVNNSKSISYNSETVGGSSPYGSYKLTIQ